MNMFCYQCEQTAKGSGCTAHGVCGKDPETAALQDLLMEICKDLARHAHRARELGGLKDQELDRFVWDALFTTITNVNFDPPRHQELVRKAKLLRPRAVALYERAAALSGQVPEKLEPAVKWWDNPDDLNLLIRQGEEATIQKRLDKLGEDVTGLQELLAYGLKGIGAYAYHASILGKESEEVNGFIHDCLDYLSSQPTDLAGLLAKNLECGQKNLKVMELLDHAHTEAYGHPEPTLVRVTPVAGKAIAVSGHDLKDLEEILKQSEGKGIKVYTHGEMLMTNSYPGLKKYSHFAGNYGGAWQDQRQDFDAFPGAILMTTNCLQKPKDSYSQRLFTTGPTAWSGIRHLPGHDFGPVIEAALQAPGFAEDAPAAYALTGFARHAVLSRADQIIAAVKEGRIRRFFLIGGCDGAKPGRNYYTELAKAVPEDCVILTLACGKYRFNKLDFGDIDGIPRLLDCGQCNDAYSAIQIALGLANAFNCSVNELPLSIVLSWFEQKAVSILLTLLALGIKNIRIGPSLPAFVSPAAFGILQQEFNLMPINTPQEDLAAMLSAEPAL